MDTTTDMDNRTTKIRTKDHIKDMKMEETLMGIRKEHTPHIMDSPTSSPTIRIMHLIIVPTTILIVHNLIHIIWILIKEVQEVSTLQAPRYL